MYTLACSILALDYVSHASKVLPFEETGMQILLNFESYPAEHCIDPYDFAGMARPAASTEQSFDPINLARYSAPAVSFPLGRPCGLPLHGTVESFLTSWSEYNYCQPFHETCQRGCGNLSTMHVCCKLHMLKHQN